MFYLNISRILFADVTHSALNGSSVILTSEVRTAIMIVFLWQ